MEFSTKDADNDKYSGNCAALYGDSGNWLNSCGHQNFNGEYGRSGYYGGRFMRWYHFDNTGMALQQMSLVLREVV